MVCITCSCQQQPHPCWGFCIVIFVIYTFFEVYSIVLMVYVYLGFIVLPNDLLSFLVSCNHSCCTFYCLARYEKFYHVIVSSVQVLWILSLYCKKTDLQLLLRPMVPVKTQRNWVLAWKWSRRTEPPAINDHKTKHICSKKNSYANPGILESG